MVFSSATFLFIFLPAVYLLNLVVKNLRAQNYVLIAASLLFYAWGEPVYVLLMVLSAFMNYLVTLKIGTAEDAGRKKALVVLAIVLNIGMLGFFKYTNFIIDTINGISGAGLAHVAATLPIGISFFTFQALSYVIDVYRGTTRANKSFANILLYISFFPQLIAGPIVKYHDISMQISDRSMTARDSALGLRRFSIGLAKKVLVANVLGSVADQVYGLSGSDMNISISWIGVFAYVMQIYFDFSGYSDMAIGLAQMFGFKLKENFNYPYISKSIKEFWRRWHISLSTWFKEYVYFPLGGNRKGRIRTGVNKVIIFTLTGLWHGASFTFLVWGLFHGFFIMMESYGIINTQKMPKILSWVYTMLVVAVGFAMFRADSFAQSGAIISNLFTGFRFTAATASVTSVLLSPIVVVTASVAVVASTPLVPYIRSKNRLKPKTYETAGFFVAAGLFVLSVLALSMSAYNPFIYFRF